MPRLLTLSLAVLGLVGGTLLLLFAADLATAPPHTQVGLFSVWEKTKLGLSVRPLQYVLIGTGTVIAAALAVALTVRASGSESGRYLRISLALGSAATGWVVAVHPWLAMQGALPGVLMSLSATISTCGMMTSLWLFGRFSANFPKPVELADLPKRSTDSWSLWREFRVRPRFFEAADSRAPIIDARLHSILQSRGWLVALCVLSVIAIWVPSTLVHVLIFAALWLLFPGLVYLPASMGYWEINYVRGDETQRRMTRWMLASIYVAAVVYGVITLSFIAIAGLSEFSHVDAGETVVVALLVFLLPSAWLLLLLAIVASILLRGAVEPALVLRRTVVYSSIVLVLTATFVVVENALQTHVLAALGLPEQTGLVITGTLVALAVGALKEKLERRVSGWVDRLLPPA